MQNYLTKIVGLALMALFVISPNYANAQGIELQVYPAGMIGVLSHQFSTGDGIEGRLHAGVNVTNRRDWGVQDDESGHGFGGGVEVDWFLRRFSDRLFAGGRIDMWSMKIDWRNDTVGIEADSRILVFQPTIRMGYRVGSVNLPIDLTLGFGLEKNIATHGEPVGEGAILLAGLRLSR